MQAPLRVSFGSASEVRRVHTFGWVTLTEDQDSLELIQSWKQTPGGQRLGGDLAVAWVGGDLAVGRAMAGWGGSGRTGCWDWFLSRGARGTPEGTAKQITTERKRKSQQQIQEKGEKRKNLTSLGAWMSRPVRAEALRRLTEAKASGWGQRGCRGRAGVGGRT